MTKRAILWCGQVRQQGLRWTPEGRQAEFDDPLRATDDFRLQANGLELAFNAALKLGVSPSDVYACLVRDDLRPPRLSGKCEEATVAGLQRVFEAIAGRAAPDDALLFVAVNHGLCDGLVTATQPDEFGDEPVDSHLTPVKLDDCLRELGGPQVVIIAACYAGVFLSLGQRPDRAVLAACAAEETYSIQRSSLCSPFLDELFGAWSGVSLSDAVPRERRDLEAAYEQAKARLEAAGAPQLPICKGTARWPP